MMRPLLTFLPCYVAGGELERSSHAVVDRYWAGIFVLMMGVITPFT
jgi:hypothetical protein